ncbi:MAG: glycosyltransferase family 39 protein [Alphaproteobacteria bacterium]|nr:glycosyltransferase family 39 protein [Alphaproteobacteria bacterium]
MLTGNSKFYRYAAWAVFAVVLVLILLTFLDYGITWDEELQSQYGLAIADYYASWFKDHRFDEIFNLYLYGGMFDGLAAVVDQYLPLRIYDSRHLLNALFGLLGMWGTWRVGRLLGDGATALLALILLATVPMYYGHMFNNPKDIPFAVGIIWIVYFMTRSYAKPELPVLLKLGVVLGLTLGVRVGGAMIFFFWLAPMGIVAGLPWLRQRNGENARVVFKDVWHKAWRVVLPVGAVGYAVMLLCWPWAQQNPIMNPLHALAEFSNFPQIVEVLFDGTTYMSTDLPWYYVPLYFGIQLPELLLFLLAASVFFLPKTWRHFTLAQKQGFSLIVLMMGVPVLYAMLRHPALYDNVRHFLFAVPLMCVVAALGARTGFVWCVSQFRNHAAKHAVAAALCVFVAILLGSQIVIMARLHPYEYIYDNQFIGGVSGAYGKYSSDYWGSSFKDAAQRIQELVAKEGGVPDGKIFKIAICGPWDAAMIYLPPDYEAVTADKPADFFLATTRWMCQNMRPGKEVIRIQRMGVPLAVVKDLRGGFEVYKGK